MLARKGGGALSSWGLTCNLGGNSKFISPIPAELGARLGVSVEPTNFKKYNKIRFFLKRE